MRWTLLQIQRTRGSCKTEYTVISGQTIHKGKVFALCCHLDNNGHLSYTQNEGLDIGKREKRILSGMSHRPQSISEETGNTDRSQNTDTELSGLPELPPGVFIPAPGTTPRSRTRWPDAIDVIFEKDPACSSIFEALLYQGLWAIIYHRIAHALYRWHVPFLPRLISQFARFITGGIEIHPGARIGKRFFIDHGAGVVIGETAEIGNNVMLYHQVTLGATGWWRPSPGREQKRHPTIEDDVTIGVGAAILGPITIGRGSRIGAMAIVLESVPPNSVVAAKPAELLMKGGKPLEKHQELTQGWNGKDPWEMDYQI